MTNFEYYKNVIADAFVSNDDCRIIARMAGIPCETAGSCFKCRKEIVKWCQEEYKIDWGSVPIDTKILVRTTLNDAWIKRYFAGYKDGEVYVWPYGKTSWTALGINDRVSYIYAKLLEE